MLTHFPIGPLADGTYLVAYITPGCMVLTVAADALTLDGATAEAARRNDRQLPPPEDSGLLIKDIE